MAKSLPGLAEVQNGDLAIHSSGPQVKGLLGLHRLFGSLSPCASSPRHRLWFCYGSHHYQYRALLFGLLAAARVFTKILMAAVAHLCLQGVFLYPYLDDILIHSRSWPSCHLSTDILERQVAAISTVLGADSETASICRRRGYPRCRNVSRPLPELVRIPSF